MRPLPRSCRRALRRRSTGWLSTYPGHKFRREEEQDMLKESDKIDALVRKAVFGSEDEKAHARWMIWEMGQQAGVRPASIHELYMARGRGEVPAFTPPAMNVRVLAYDTGRACSRAAKRQDAGACIRDIASIDIAYTDH